MSTESKFAIGDKIDVADCVFWNYTTGGVVVDIEEDDYVIPNEGERKRGFFYSFTMEGKIGVFEILEDFVRKTGDTNCYCEQCLKRREENVG